MKIPASGILLSPFLPLAALGQSTVSTPTHVMIGTCNAGSVIFECYQVATPPFYLYPSGDSSAGKREYCDFLLGHHRFDATLTINGVSYPEDKIFADAVIQLAAKEGK